MRFTRINLSSCLNFCFQKVEGRLYVCFLEDLGRASESTRFWRRSHFHRIWSRRVKDKTRYKTWGTDIDIWPQRQDKKFWIKSPALCRPWCRCPSFAVRCQSDPVLLFWITAPASCGFVPTAHRVGESPNFCWWNPCTNRRWIPDFCRKSVQPPQASSIYRWPMSSRVKISVPSTSLRRSLARPRLTFSTWGALDLFSPADALGRTHKTTEGIGNLGLSASSNVSFRCVATELKTDLALELQHEWKTQHQNSSRNGYPNTSKCP